MNALQTFTFADSHTVRTVIEDGQVKFVASDICNALGLENPSKATTNLGEDEKGITIADTPGGRQPMITITESGLYTLIFKSRKPEAQAFRKWVTSEVLPALRTTGTYTVAPQQATLPQNYLEALKALVTTTEQAESLKLTVAAQQPAVEFVERYVQASGLFGIRETAKLLNLGPQEFVKRCQQHKILYREGGTLQPYAQHLKNGYFAVKAGESNDHAYTQTRFTAKGIEWLRRQLFPIPFTLSAA
jgi:prophage antirepressor-like protein